MSLAFGFAPTDQNNYNCSSLTYEDALAKGERRLLYGIYYIATGVVTLCLYILVVFAMSDRRLLKQSCFKLMYFNCFIDMGNIICGGIFSGILFLEGATYCTHPKIIWVVGSCGLACWCAACSNCLSLGFNRVSIMTQTWTWLFQGKRTFYWITFSMCMFFTAGLLTRPPLFNSKLGTWLMCPLINDLETEVQSIYNYFHVTVNITTACVMTLTYLCLCSYLLHKKGLALFRSNRQHDGLQIKLFFQVVLICLSTGTAAYVYMYMQFFKVPEWFYMLASFGYQWASFAPCVVYMTMNKDIRARLKKILYCNENTTPFTVSTVRPTISQNKTN